MESLHWFVKQIDKILLSPNSLDVDAAYQDFCNIINKASKRTIPHIIKINLFHVGMQSVNHSIKLSCSLLMETTSVWLLQLYLLNLIRSRGIDGSKQFGASTFLHSSQKAWSILNNLTGRSFHSFCRCLVSADAIASQLVRYGRYKAVDCKSSQLVSQEVSNL